MSTDRDAAAEQLRISMRSLEIDLASLLGCSWADQMDVQAALAVFAHLRQRVRTILNPTKEEVIMSERMAAAGYIGTRILPGAQALDTNRPQNNRHLAEADPTGKQSHEPGAKLDAGKVPVMRGAIQYSPRALEEVAKVSAFGARKYAWKGWETVPDGVNRYGDAMCRHMLKETYGSARDEDSGLLHAAHAAWNALARLELMLREPDAGRDEVMAQTLGGRY